MQHFVGLHESFISVATVRPGAFRKKGHIAALQFKNYTLKQSIKFRVDRVKLQVRPLKKTIKVFYRHHAVRASGEKTATRLLICF